MKKVIICGLYYLDVTPEKVNQPGASLWTLNSFYHYYPQTWFKPDQVWQIHMNFPRVVNTMNMANWVERYKEYDAEIVVTTDYGFQRQRFFNPFPVICRFGELAMTSSVSMMIAQAIIDGYDAIDLLGVRMKTDGEHAYQAPGVKYMIGEARAAGVDVFATYEPEWDKVDACPKGSEILYGGFLKTTLEVLK